MRITVSKGRLVLDETIDGFSISAHPDEFAEAVLQLPPVVRPGVPRNALTALDLFRMLPNDLRTALAAHPSLTGLLSGFRDVRAAAGLSPLTGGAILETVDVLIPPIDTVVFYTTGLSLVYLSKGIDRTFAEYAYFAHEPLQSTLAKLLARRVPALQRAMQLLQQDPAVYDITYRHGWSVGTMSIVARDSQQVDAAVRAIHQQRLGSETLDITTGDNPCPP